MPAQHMADDRSGAVGDRSSGGPLRERS